MLWPKRCRSWTESWRKFEALSCVSAGLKFRVHLCRSMPRRNDGDRRRGQRCDRPFGQAVHKMSKAMLPMLRRCGGSAARALALHRGQEHGALSDGTDMGPDRRRDASTATTNVIARLCLRSPDCRATSRCAQLRTPRHGPPTPKDLHSRRLLRGSSWEPLRVLDG